MLKHLLPHTPRALRSALAASAAAISLVAHAAPPQLTQQAPGFYREQVGDFTVTAVYDGYIRLAPALLKGMSAQDVQSLLARMFQSADNGGVQTAVNAFLVHTGKQLVLVDAGAAKCFGPTMGNIVENVKAAGYKPSDVDTVLLTHMHPDHICGLVTADGKPAFPKATVYAAAQEASFWLDKKVAQAAPEGNRPFFKMAQDAIAPYVAKGAFKTFENGAQLVPGFSAVPTNGHTPGHTSYLIESGKDKLLLWGDIVHAHAIQLRHPEVSVEFDASPEQAIVARQRIFEQSARQGWLIGGAHLPFPGLGHVRKDDAGYSWVPVEYAPTGTK